MADTPIADAQIFTYKRENTIDLYGRFSRTESWSEEIMKSPDPEDKPKQHSDQGVMLGEKYPPFNMEQAIAFKNQNPHHSTCIETKSRAMVGMGFEDDMVSDELDPLCDTTFQDIMNSVAEDYAQVGNGYIEVVRAKRGDSIVGLHYVPASTVRIVVENTDYNIYYGVRGELGIKPMLLAPFGERKQFLKRINGKGPKKNDVAFRAAATSYGSPSLRSEIIHFKRCTSMSRWYGFPDWLSCIAHIELVQMLVQERFDFAQNRGVPEFFVFVTGAKLDQETWRRIEQAMQATIGLGNQHKSLAINVANQDMKFQVEKLAIEGGKGANEFATMMESISLDIVTSHRTPPILAHIQVPGKMGATNELPNALLSFQVLVIGPEQHTIESVLKNTLGSLKKNGGLKTRAKNFKLKTIVQQIPLGMGQQQPGGTGTGIGAPAGVNDGIKGLDTQSRMRTPAASSNGRDMSAGVKN